MRQLDGVCVCDMASPKNAVLYPNFSYYCLIKHIETYAMTERSFEELWCSFLYKTNIGLDGISCTCVCSCM